MDEHVTPAERDETERRAIVAWLRPLIENDKAAPNAGESVIADCDAKLRMLDELLPSIGRADDMIANEFCEDPGNATMLVRLLAAAYRHRPGWKEGWAP